MPYVSKSVIKLQGWLFSRLPLFFPIYKEINIPFCQKTHLCPYFYNLKSLQILGFSHIICNYGKLGYIISKNVSYVNIDKFGEELKFLKYIIISKSVIKLQGCHFQDGHYLCLCPIYQKINFPFCQKTHLCPYFYNLKSSYKGFSHIICDYVKL